MKNIVMLLIIIASNVYATDFYDDHDKIVRKNNKLLVKSKNSIENLYNLQIKSMDASFKEQLIFFFKNYQLEELNRIKVVKKDKFVSNSLVLIDKILQAPNTNILERNIISFLKKVGVKRKEQVRKIGYLILFRMNMFLKIIGAYDIKWKGLDHLLLQTYYVANKFRALDLFNSQPKFSFYKLMNLGEFFNGFDDKELYANFNVDDKQSEKKINLTLSYDKKYFGPNIYIISAKSAKLVANEIEFHPLALIYAPGTNFTFEKNKYLYLINPNVITKASKSSKQKIIVSDADRFIIQSFNYAQYKSYIKYWHCDFTTSKSNDSFHYSYQFSVKSSKLLNPPKYKAPMNGGSIKARADKLVGIVHLNASGTNGNDGVDGQSSLSCIGNTLVRLPVLSKFISSEYNIATLDHRFEEILDKHGTTMLELEMPGVAGDGQHGSHGGDISIEVSGKQLNSNASFLDYSKSNYGKGGKPGNVSKCSNPYFHNRNNYKGTPGLDGGYGKITNLFIF